MQDLFRKISELDSDKEQREIGLMLYSKERNIKVKIDAKKVAKGQFNTTSDTWFLPQIKEFILKSGKSRCLDPFAGKGDILNLIKKECGLETVGLDIDPNLGWDLNDSLLNIPIEYKDCIIITNPPYLAKYSASRKGVFKNLESYYSKWDDLYMQALDRCLEHNDYVVAIIPETFINSDYVKQYCASISIVLKNPFTDTDCPVCVVCLTKDKRPFDLIKVYIDEEEISTYGKLLEHKLTPDSSLKIKFNDRNGNIGLRAVDLTCVNDKIQFLTPDDLNYSRDDIKISSRLITFLSINGVSDKNIIFDIITESNKILNQWRCETRDIMLSPFKGNAKDGTRRRRLDYRSARAILERAYKKVCNVKQQSTFWEL